jgi:hypothetical protein
MLLIPTSGEVPHHQAMSSNFEYLHTCHKFSSGIYKGGGVYVLKSSFPLCYEFWELFLMFVFGIVNFLSGDWEICQVVYLRATS